MQPVGHFLGLPQAQAALQYKGREGREVVSFFRLSEHDLICSLLPIRPALIIFCCAEWRSRGERDLGLVATRELHDRSAELDSQFQAGWWMFQTN